MTIISSIIFTTIMTTSTINNPSISNTNYLNEESVLEEEVKIKTIINEEVDSSSILLKDEAIVDNSLRRIKKEVFDDQIENDQIETIKEQSIEKINLLRKLVI